MVSGVVSRRRSRKKLCSMQLGMGSCLNRTVHSLLLGCVICMGWMSQPTVCLLSLKALCFLTIGNRMRGFDDCEQGWVQRRRQRCSQGQGKKGKEVEVKKAIFVFSNRPFPVGKEASFNSACPSGDCRVQLHLQLQAGSLHGISFQFRSQPRSRYGKDRK